MIGRVTLLGALAWLIIAAATDNELSRVTAIVCANVFIVGYLLAVKIDADR